MLNNKTKLVAKIDPLKYLLSKSALTGQMAKWVMLLNEFDIEYVNQKAIKGQVLADHLAEAPLSENRPLSIGFPDESILSLEESPEWTLYFDGSFTTHGSSAGIVFATPQGDLIPKVFRIGFPCTNNIAEYEALISGLKLAIQWNIQHLLVLERKSFIQRASRYVILGNTLYRRGYDGTLLKCLNSEEVNLAIKEVHEGICGAHTSGMVLGKKLLRTGYYWPTMERDSCQYVRRCVA
eukprot:Gb_19959 [translate_table: standard]